MKLRRAYELCTVGLDSACPLHRPFDHAFITTHPRICSAGSSRLQPSPIGHPQPSRRRSRRRAATSNNLLPVRVLFFGPDIVTCKPSIRLPTRSRTSDSFYQFDAAYSCEQEGSREPFLYLAGCDFSHPNVYGLPTTTTNHHNILHLYRRCAWKLLNRIQLR